MANKYDSNPYDFNNPPPDCSIAYFWIINDKVDVKVCKQQLKDMAAHGLQAVCFHPEPPEFRPVAMATRLDLPYLSKPYFKFVREMVKTCADLGMHYWLYDEGGWPSGNACGQVMKSNPERFRQMRIAKGKDGHAFIETLPAQDASGRYGYPNLLTPGVAEAFIKLTHDGHKKAAGEFFGKTLKFVFQDEACFCRNAWTEDFPKMFKRWKGYDIMPYLDVLLQEPKDDDSEEIIKIRIDYQDVRSRLFAERFVLPIRTWCRRNKLLSGGHFGGEDDPRNNVLHGYGHIMRVLRYLDVPGVDVIWQQLFPGVRSHVFPKYASSIARQSGRDRSLTETAAVFGNGLTPLQLKWLLEYQLVRGINTIVLSCYEMSTKDHLLYVNPRPQCGPDDPLWPYSNLWHTYFARLCYILKQGKADCHVALYYDVRSIWAGASKGEAAARIHEEISQKLLERQIDFDFVDDDALGKPKTKVYDDGSFKIGAMMYDTLIIPSRNRMTPEAKRFVKRISTRGGMVLDETQLDRIKPVIDISPATDAIRATKRIWDGIPYYFLVNESDKTVETTIHIDNEWGLPLQLDPMTGDCLWLPCNEENNSFDWTFEPFGSLLFCLESAEERRELQDLADEDDLDDVELDDELDDDDLDEDKQEIANITLKKGWTLTPVTKYVISENGVDHVDMNGQPPVKLKSLGDWQETLGVDFSGEACYETTFTLTEKPLEAFLSLGKVNYVCTIIVNGIEVAKCYWPPYGCDIPENCLKKGKNKLEIRVSNTLANAINAPGVLETWKQRYPQQSDNYDQRERPFERESLPSGLFGPVTLAFE
ncbi:MAG: hypothetical protein J6X49_05435 [Victivallales bacterium]|nr:hypothetical protein [Victivallales bacterium]